MFPLSRLHTKSLFLLQRACYSFQASPMQKIIMLCGAPGTGKGTYARLLADDFGYVKISPGDEIRKLLTSNPKDHAGTYTPSTIARLKGYMKSGKLVPDDVIMEIMYQKIKEPGCSKGVILDGFPRTVGQLNMFSEAFPIHLVINIKQSHEYLMASTLGRRTCMGCGMSYSAESFYKNGYELDVMMPKKENVCDECGGEVKRRDDDREDVIKARLREHDVKTRPVLRKVLASGGTVIDFEAKRGIRDYPKLQQIIVSQVGLPFYYHHFQNPDFSTPLIYN